MAKPIGSLSFPKENQCSACRITFQPTTRVILTNGDSVLCATHRGLIVPEAVFAEGPYRDIRKEQLRRRRAV